MVWLIHSKHTMKIASFLFVLLLLSAPASAQEVNDVTTPLHLLRPDYKTPYGSLKPADVKATIDRVFAYIDAVTPATMVDGRIHQGTFRLTSYEWAVMYDALLDATAITGDKRYADYVSNRIGFLAREAKRFKGDLAQDGQMRQVAKPLTLDDAGAMAGAWMRAAMADRKLDVSFFIEQYWNIVKTGPVLLADGTIARHRPHHNAVWLDDMFMALPSLAVRSQYTGKPDELNRAAEMATGFLRRMWMPETGLFRHGYVEGAAYEPSFAWGRANGWAILTLCQLLDALPENHPLRPQLMDCYKKHAATLARLQGINGFWHQLLDRNETYEETSCTAIFAYALAHGINRGWLPAVTYGPVAQLAWEAVNTMVTDKGEVKGVCVGTGMGFDAAYYAYRPVSAKAAHGYGPVVWAGAEMWQLLSHQFARSNDSAIHYYATDPEATTPIFSLDEKGKATEVIH